MLSTFEKFWLGYGVFVVIVCIVCILGILGVWGNVHRTIQRTVTSVDDTEFQKVMDSVKNHELTYKEKHIEIDAVIERRIDHDTVMLSSFASDDKVWWYVNTHEDEDGHHTIYGYKEGEVHTLRLYIRDIDYKPYENDGEGRYYVWSEIFE